MNLRIQITIQDNQGNTEVHPVDVNVEMPEDGPMIIDHVEQEILRVHRNVIRNTMSAYLEELSKKSPNCGRKSKLRGHAQCARLCRRRRSRPIHFPNPYRHRRPWSAVEHRDASLRGPRAARVVSHGWHARAPTANGYPHVYIVQPSLS